MAEPVDTKRLAKKLGIQHWTENEDKPTCKTCIEYSDSDTVDWWKE